MAKNKTRIDVITVFDGELDATDVFVSLIAQKHSQKFSEESGKNNLAKTQDLCYRPMGAAVRAAEKAVGGGEPMTCRGAALRRSPAFTTSGHFVPKW